MTVLDRSATTTLTPFELDLGDALRFRLDSGAERTIRLLATHAEIVRTTLPLPLVETKGAVTIVAFWADVEVDGERHRLWREIGTQRSFYEPWCPLQPGGLSIHDCYTGEDCWLGAYYDAAAHGGLDINHPAGTPIFAPLDLDDHFLFENVYDGHTSNRWRGLKRWPDGRTWELGCHHGVRLTAPAHQPIAAGTQVARGAGVAVGSHEHSHFTFAIRDGDDLIRLDPWIFFWQTYQDVHGRTGARVGHLESGAHG